MIGRRSAFISVTSSPGFLYCGFENVILKLQIASIMRKILLTLAIAAGSFAVKAQTVASFESLTLSKVKDTSYINFSKPGKDVGFDDGLAHFPCLYDTAYGGYWVGGFSYSNWTDTATSGYTNQYSAKPGSGFAASAQYAVCYGTDNILSLKGAAIGQSVMGFYVTNNTYAYNSMRDGDGFAKKFSGADKDWYRLDIFGYTGSKLKTTDSVSFYLADFRNTDTTLNYIVNDWQWVNLLPLGHVDSLYFRLSSSDTAGGYLNTPAYFCMDDFTTNETGLSVAGIANAGSIKVYPNPATTTLTIDAGAQTVLNAAITDVAGRTIAQYPMTGNKLEINTASLIPGTYLLVLRNATQQTSLRFNKQ